MTEKHSEASSNDNNGKTKTQPTPVWVYIALLATAVISYVAMPRPLQPPHGEEPSIQHVFYYGWLTAVSTGLGAVPLAFAPNLASYWVGISNGECSQDECDVMGDTEFFYHLMYLKSSRCCGYDDYGQLFPRLRGVYLR